MSNQYLFSSVPVIHHSRSQQDLSHIVKTTANVGDLCPFDVQEVYPGDSMKVKTNIVSRLSSTFLRPVMDNLFLDVYYFFVPSRILYDKWVNIFGENTDSPWANTKEYEVPHLGVGAQTANGKIINNFSLTIADRMGIPVGDAASSPTLSRNLKVNVLPFRAFAKIYDDWFRDQNNVDPMHIQTGELGASEYIGNGLWTPNYYMGMPPKVAKLHDYFTSALPSPQKGDAGFVPVTLGSDDSVVVPVTGQAQDFSVGSQPFRLSNSTGQPYPLILSAPTDVAGMGQIRIATSDVAFGGTSSITRSNLAVELNSQNLQSRITVSDLRYATQVQLILERDARSGSRYTEYLRAAFGVESPDARLQRSEFLGGRRIPISITQVVQSTGANSSTSPLGELAGFSQTSGKALANYNKGFVEHGYVIGVFAIRQFHTYQQGLERFWTRTKRFDFYDHTLSHISEQPVYASELFAFGEAEGEERRVFGYNEAWADLRNRPNYITGQLRSSAADSLDFWHFGDNYVNAPVLGKEFIEETSAYVDRAITVQSEAQQQFILDFYIQNRAFRIMPTRSIPGLLDHH